MRTIKKLNLRFGQLLNEQQQSMVLAGAKAPCGCEKSGDLCASSAQCNLPLYQWVCAAAANLVMKPGPSGISLLAARDRLKSGWAKYVEDCQNAQGSIDENITRSTTSHLVRECTYVNSRPDQNGIYQALHNDLGTVFTE